MRFWVVRSRTLAALGIFTVFFASVAIYYNVRQAQQVFSVWEHGHTLVLDAGHGGFDGGAVGGAGTTEQHINLSIAERTQMLAGFFGIETVMTRTNAESLGYDASKSVRENKVSDIKMRERMAMDAEDPVFLSIHLNKYPEGKYWGAQTFYSKNHPQAKLLGELLQERLITGLNSANRRRAKQAVDTIYLMKKLTCPAVVVECGFLSNEEEEQLLQQEEYHKRISICMISGYLQFLASEGA